jgi:hypothetical protein
MKFVWGLGIAAMFAAISYYAGYWEVGVIPFAGLGAAYVASVIGVSGAAIFTVLSLGGRVNIITFLGILIAVAVLLALIWRDYVG